MTESDTIRIEVVFGLADRQKLVSIDIDAGADCADAISQSGIAAEFPELDLNVLPVAIWGRPAARSNGLKDGDRIEILRPLQMDPRDARRQLAIDGQFMGGAVTDENQQPG